MSNTLDLITAALKGDKDGVCAALDAGADIHFSDDLALRQAARFNHGSVVRLLLDRGADIHAMNDDALHWAAEGGHEPVVRLLLDRGADIHAVDDWALFQAARNGHEAVVRLLLDRGANIHGHNDRVRRNAARNGHKSVVQLLDRHKTPAVGIPTVAEPRNNDGREVCFWCGEPTRKFGLNFGDICTACGR